MPTATTSETTSTLSTSTTTSTVLALATFSTTSSTAPAAHATTGASTRRRGTTSITPRPARTHVPLPARPVHPAHPIVPVPVRPVTVTLPVPRPTTGFTFNLTTKTFGTAATPLVVVEFVPITLPRVTVPPVVRAPAKKLVQNDTAAVVSAAPSTAEREPSGMAAPVAVGALVVAAVGAAVVVRQRRHRRDQAARGHAVQTDDEDSDCAHDNVAAPLV
ncbi:hypothetical protein GGF32_000274 [Allomyces javanicus]|nr:hypothetical protein GGF32_000274 [Allomyces javanicus]